MGYWLRDKVKSWSSLGLDDIQRWDLPSSGLLSTIQVVANVNRDDTARTASTKAALLEDGVDAIEIIEGGSKVIKSLDGPVLMAHNLFDFKQIPYYQQAGMADDYNIVNFFLNFGRYPMDPVFGLDLAKHEDCQLVIDHNFSSTDKVGFKADSVAFDVWVWRYIGPEITSTGYFKTSEKEAYTQGSTSGAEHRLELPRKNAIRRLLVRSYLTQKTPGECITSIELEVNDGEYKPVYATPFVSNSAYYALKQIMAIAYGNDGVPGTATDVHVETNIPYSNDMSALYVNSSAAQTSAMYRKQEAADLQFYAQAANFEFTWRNQGTGFQHVTPVCFDIPDDPASYFETAELSKVELIITEAGQASANKIVLDELILY